MFNLHLIISIISTKSYNNSNIYKPKDQLKFLICNYYTFYRASKQKKTTKSKDIPITDIQRDSCGMESGLGDSGEGEASLESEDIIFSSGDEFKNLINNLKENCDSTCLTAEIHESSDGEISITWKVRSCVLF